MCMIMLYCLIVLTMFSSLFLRKSSELERATSRSCAWSLACNLPNPHSDSGLWEQALLLNGGRFQASHGRGGHIRLKAASWSTPRSPVSPDKGRNSISEGGKEGGDGEAQRTGEKRREKNSSENWYRTEKIQVEEIANHFNHFASKRKQREDEEGSWFWRMADKQEEEPSCFFAFFSTCLFSLTVPSSLSLSLFPSLSLPLLKWQQTPPTLGGQATFFVCLEKAGPGIVTVDDPRSSRLASLPQSIQLGDLTQEHAEEIQSKHGHINC